MRATGRTHASEVRRIVGTRGLRQVEHGARQDGAAGSGAGLLHGDGTDKREVGSVVLRRVREGVRRRWRGVDRVEEGEGLEEGHRPSSPDLCR